MNDGHDYVKPRFIWDLHCLVHWVRQDPEWHLFAKKSEVGIRSISMTTLFLALDMLSSTKEGSNKLEQYVEAIKPHFALIDAIELDIPKAIELLSNARSMNVDLGADRLLNATLVKNFGCTVLAVANDRPTYLSVLGEGEVVRLN